MRRLHPIKHVAISGAENHNYPFDVNVIEMLTEPQETNQTRGGFASNETSAWITEDEAINENLKVYNVPAHNKTKFDPFQFLHSYYDKSLKILRTALLKNMSNADEVPCKLVKFESQNGISVNVFGSEKEQFIPFIWQSSVSSVSLIFE